MNESTLLSGLKWLWSHKPDVVILIVVTIGAVWLTGQFISFGSRIHKTEEVCTNITEVQLPAIRDDMRDMQERIDKRFEQVDEQFKRVDEQFKRVDEQFKRVDEQLFEIKAYLIKIDTYLATTSKNYPKK